MDQGTFAGFARLGQNFITSILVTTDEGIPVNADAAPTCHVYYGGTRLTTVTCTEQHSGSVGGATNASPIVITSNGHGLETGQVVTVESVGGNTAANGTWLITKVNANSFSLDGSTGNGAYTSGGDWNTTGRYLATVPVTVGNNFTSGGPFDLCFEYEVSSDINSQSQKMFVD